MAEPKIFVWQWGRFGSGPRFAFELARAMRRHSGADVLLSLAEGAELMSSSICREEVSLPLETYSTSAQFAARSLIHRRHLAPIFAQLERDPPTVALSVMPGYWDLFVIRHLRRLGIPVVTIVHDAANHPGDRLQLIHHVQRLMIKESTAVITLTDFVAQCLHDQDRIGDRVHQTIAHPALTFPDLDLPQPELPGYPERTPLRVLLTGRLRKYKGMDLFLHALAMIDPARLDVRMAGAINDKPTMKKAKAQANVELHNGWMSEQEFISNLDWCDVVVLPYREASQSGIIPAAFARRRPVIVTPVGGLPEQVRHETTGLVTEGVSGEAIARAIRRLIDAPDLLNNMADNAYRQAGNELSANEIGRRFVEFLSGVSRAKN